MLNLINAARTLAIWFDRLRQALFAPGMPFALRWRLLILQQVTLLLVPLKTLPWTFSRAYRMVWIPGRGGHMLRALVFEPRGPLQSRDIGLRPLHIDFHAGGFCGGVAEMDNAFCHQICRRTGAVVVSVDYRVAPQHVYPAAHEDCEDAVSWLLTNAKQMFHADPDCLTVSGFSAGGNAMMVAGARVRAAVGFYSAIELRKAPWEKPRPLNFPTKDPFTVLLPLYDAYAGPARETHMHDSRMSPVIKSIEDLPKNVLLIVAGIDICVHEQLTFVERVKKEIADAGQGDQRTVEAVVLEKAFHGWFELPCLPKNLHDDKLKAQDLAIDFIAKAQRNA